MRSHLQKVMSEHWIVRNFIKAKHGRLSEIDHEPEKTKQTKKQKSIMNNRIPDSPSSTALRKILLILLKTLRNSYRLQLLYKSAHFCVIVMKYYFSKTAHNNVYGIMYYDILTTLNIHQHRF